MVEYHQFEPTPTSIWRPRWNLARFYFAPEN